MLKQKIDKRKTYYCVLDTETAPIRKCNKVLFENMLVYDIGYRIIDKNNNCYLERSYIVSEIYFGEKEKMRSSYYANKLPQYDKDIAKGKRVVKTYKQVREQLSKDLKRYNCKIVSCHNAIFDYGSLFNTSYYLHDRKYFFNKDIVIWDTKTMALDTIARNKTYNVYKSNGYGKKVNAQDLYRYISHNDNFIESHTGLEDTQIESAILTKCLSQHRPMRKRLDQQDQFYRVENRVYNFAKH